jgi:hypothetical protein
MPIGAGIAAVGGSLAGGLIQSNAASQASAAAQAAAAKGNQILSNVQTTTSNNLQPFVNTGQEYNSALAGLLGVGGNPAASSAAFNNYLDSTNYQFQLGQGEQAVETANAPAFSSSATAKALNNYAQGQAGSALQGYENLLSTGTGQGITAGTNLGSLSNANAGAQASNLLAAAGVQGSADIYGANAITGALSGITSGLSSFGSGNAGSALQNLFGGGGQAAVNGFNSSQAAYALPANTSLLPLAADI